MINNNTWQVFLLTSRAHFPFSIASHSWFVTNKMGKISRWEVLHKRNDDYWGYIHRDANPPFRGLGVFHLGKKYNWSGILLGSANGELAKGMIEFIERSGEDYHHKRRYFLTGPNSNTYIQWILDKFPEFKASLPRSAIGKNHKRK